MEIFSDGSKNECLKRKVMNCSIIDIKSLNVGEYCGQVEVNDKINCSTLQTSRSLSNDDSHSVDSVVIENSDLDSGCRVDGDFNEPRIHSNDDGVAAQPTVRRPAQFSQNNTSNSAKKLRECPLCFIRQSEKNFPQLACCNHRSCKSCLVQYLQVEIMESRVQITCPECSEFLHPTDIYSLMVQHPDLIEKYENFSLRRVLMTDPDTRWCPAPDCTYAVIATSCAACPELHCEKCGTLFCYHCKGPWHASQTCDEARRERGRKLRNTVPRRHRGDIKPCPRCRTYIVKLDDGSCNHMAC
ncbi:unnamed protein product, partial [Dracunculus medinensis]|uniref:RBR-type E3 ubiquitin transferase n=1 Tax=Dracunculus medinensis TaxID=318479 RepID=A0A0N4UNF6_DRAME